MDTPRFPMLCRESMRMMPVSADGTFRVSATDLKVGPHTIPAGKHRHRLHRMSNKKSEVSRDTVLLSCRCAHLGSICSHVQPPFCVGVARRVQAGRDRASICLVWHTARRVRMGQPAGLVLQERWLDPEAEYATTPNPYNSSAKSKRFFPFSQGQRNCVGRGLATMNYAATVARLYSHFTFKLADDVRSFVTHEMLDPIRMQVPSDELEVILNFIDISMGQMGDLNAIWQREWMNLTR
jgi:cytochrome P450